MNAPIALNFSFNGQRKGIWLQPETLAPEAWAKLSGSLFKTRLPGARSVIHVASTTAWSTQVIYGDTVCRTRAAHRILTGQMLTVAEPTIVGVLAAIGEDEEKLLAVPFDPPRRPPRHFNSMAVAAGIQSH